MEFSLVKGDRQAIGSSDWGDILNIAPYGCGRRAFYRISGAMPDTDDESNKYMERGKRLESLIIDMYTERTGHIVSRETAETSFSFGDRMVANLDGMVYLKGKPHINIEAKTMGADTWKEFQADGLPQSYTFQVQYQMWLSSAPHTDVCCLWPDGWELEITRVDADANIHRALQDIANKFLGDVDDGVPPARLPEKAFTCWSCPFNVTCWQGVKAEPEPEPPALIDPKAIENVSQFYNYNSQVKFDSKVRDKYKKEVRKLVDLHGGKFWAGDDFVELNITKSGQQRLTVKRKGVEL